MQHLPMDPLIGLIGGSRSNRHCTSWNYLIFLPYYYYVSISYLSVIGREAEGISILIWRTYLLSKYWPYSKLFLFLTTFSKFHKNSFSSVLYQTILQQFRAPTKRNSDQRRVLTHFASWITQAQRVSDKYREFVHSRDTTLYVVAWR